MRGWTHQPDTQDKKQRTTWATRTAQTINGILKLL